MRLVQFARLEDLLQEVFDQATLPPPRLRVEAMRHLSNTKFPHLLNHFVGVQVTAALDAELLACFVLVRHLVLPDPSQQTPTDQAAYQTAWADANELAHRIRVHIEERALPAGAGMYDLGTTKILQGVWAGDPRGPVVGDVYLAEEVRS